MKLKRCIDRMILILVPTVPWALPVQRGIRGVLRSIFRIYWYFPGLRGELQLRFPRLLWALLLRCCSSCLVFCWLVCTVNWFAQDPRMDGSVINRLILRSSFVGGWLSSSCRFSLSFFKHPLSSFFSLLFLFGKGGNWTVINTPKRGNNRKMTWWNNKSSSPAEAQMKVKAS